MAMRAWEETLWQRIGEAAGIGSVKQFAQHSSHDMQSF
jgi:hypothetical protein